MRQNFHGPNFLNHDETSTSFSFFSPRARRNSVQTSHIFLFQKTTIWSARARLLPYCYRCRLQKWKLDGKGDMSIADFRTGIVPYYTFFWIVLIGILVNEKTQKLKGRKVNGNNEPIDQDSLIVWTIIIMQTSFLREICVKSMKQYNTRPEWAR